LIGAVPATPDVAEPSTNTFSDVIGFAAVTVVLAAQAKPMRTMPRARDAKSLGMPCRVRYLLAAEIAFVARPRWVGLASPSLCHTRLSEK
jgi:hypothetical protein